MPEARIVVEVERRAGGTVARVTVDNQRRLNTLTSPLIGELTAALERLARDEELRAVVLAGAGDKAFVGGADIGELARLDPASGCDFITRLHRCCEAVRDLPVPAIAVCRGYTLGAGLELAASCDLRVAADDAVFGMPEVRVGIPSVIEAALLPLLVGWGRAREILLLGENFGAAEAERWGLVQRAMPAAALDGAVEAWLAAIFRCGPRAVRIQKKLVRAWEDLPIRDAVEAGIDAFARSLETDEPTKMMQAFLDRKKR